MRRLAKLIDSKGFIQVIELHEPLPLVYLLPVVTPIDIASMISDDGFLKAPDKAQCSRIEFRLYDSDANIAIYRQI